MDIQSFRVQPDVLHYFSTEKHDVQGIIISLGNIIAFIQSAATNKDPIHSIGKGPENELQVDPAGTHDANQPDFSRILQSGNSSHVSSTVRSPMADKTKYFGFKHRSRTHSFSTPLSVSIQILGYSHIYGGRYRLLMTYNR